MWVVVLGGGQGATATCVRWCLGASISSISAT
ncbi:hypothetical protein ABH927_003032 [Planotetraspora sp. GP83]